MKKKILALALTVAMCAVAVVSGTLAYFTDTEDATNVFTVGSVDIELIESYVHRANAYAIDGSAAKTMTDDEILAGSGKAYEDYLASQQLMPGIAINKMPYVKNTGMSDAHIRIRVMIPTALDAEHLMSSIICTTALNEEFHRPAGTAMYAVDGTYTDDAGVEYNVYSFIRNEALAPDTMTTWNVWDCIRMDDDTTEIDLANLIEAGAITEDGQFNVLVQADAIQAASFADADAAFVAFDAQNN